MIKLFKIILLVFICSQAYSQKEEIKYLDEDFEIISSPLFHKKNNSPIYYSKEYMVDSLLYKRVSLKYYIDRITKKSKNQLFKLLSQRNGVDTTKSILIHYKDTLFSPVIFPKRDTIIYYTNGKHKHIKSYENFVKIHNLCERKNSTKKVSTYHFHNYNAGNSENFKKIKWHKDHLKLLRKLFYDPNSGGDSWTIMIHPNGDFVISYNTGVRISKIWSDLKKHKNWEKHKSDFKMTYESLNNN